MVEYVSPYTLLLQRRVHRRRATRRCRCLAALGCNGTRCQQEDAEGLHGDSLRRDGMCALVAESITSSLHTQAGKVFLLLHIYTSAKSCPGASALLPGSRYRHGGAGWIHSSQSTSRSGPASIVAVSTVLALDRVTKLVVEMSQCVYPEFGNPGRWSSEVYQRPAATPVPSSILQGPVLDR